MKMKVALIILAHSSPENLRLLVCKLQHPLTEIYIHIDAKSNKDPFVNALDGLNYVLVQGRVSVYWAGYSMVEAIINSLKEAINKEPYSYFCLLSGVDYPIKAIDEIVSFYENNNACFIDCLEIKSTMLQSRYLRYLHRYTEEDNKYRNSRTGKKLSGPIKWFHRARIGIKRKIIGRRDFFKDLKPYCGSAWWSLPHDAIIYILSYLENRPEFVAYMKNCRSAEEIVFATILMNSHFISRVKECFDSEKVGIDSGNNNLRYVDWSLHREKPAILAIEDYEKIIASNAHFIRKIDPQRSKELLSLLP